MPAEILVCGLGQLGFRVASLLLSLGEQVTIVTTDPRFDWRRDLERSGARIVIGDATDPLVLTDAGVERSKALIGCCDDDLTNIQMALEGRRLKPGLRVVLRLFDQNLAKHAVSTMGIEAAFGMAALSAPAFAASALGENLITAFQVEDERCVVALTDIEQESRLAGASVAHVRDKWHAQVLTRFHDFGLDFLPDPHTVIEPGDCVKLLGTEKACRTALYQKEEEVEQPRWWDHWLTSFSPIPLARFIGRLWRSAPRELKAVFLSMIVLVVVSVFVSDMVLKMRPFDALYYVVTTVTTTGYGDISPRSVPTYDALGNVVTNGPPTHYGPTLIGFELFGAFLMIMGSFMFAAMYSLITDYLVNARLQQLLGNKRAPESGQVILVGLDIVGYRVLEELNRLDIPVVLIEQNPSAKFLGSARSRASLIIGDARDEETLMAAGIKSARAIIACTGDDATNLSIGLAATSASEKTRRVLRIFDADLASKVQETFRFDAAMSASRLAAPHFVANALFGKCSAAFVSRSRLFAVGVANKDEFPERSEHDSSTDMELKGTTKPIRICIRKMLNTDVPESEELWHADGSDDQVPVGVG